MTTDADASVTDGSQDSNHQVANGVGDKEASIRIGRNYQAVVPALLDTETRDSLDHKAVLLWIPCRTMPTEDLAAYLRKSREQYNYTEEQALGMLLWHRHNVDQALSDLTNFTQRPDDWLVEEKAIFRHGLMLYSKRFNEIQRELLRERRVRDLVEYYYTKYKLDRALKLSLQAKTKKQLLSARRTTVQNGSSGNDAGDVKSEPQSPLVTNLPPFLSPSQPQSSGKVLIAPHLTSGSTYLAAGTATANDVSKASFGVSYYNYEPRRITKPRGLLLEMSEMREIIGDRTGLARNELETLQREYDSAEQRLDELRRAECRADVSERSAESRKALLSRCNRDVLQVRDRMHFNDSNAFLAKRTTQRWSQNELVLLQTMLKRNLREAGSLASLLVDVLHNRNRGVNDNGNGNGNGNGHIHLNLTVDLNADGPALARASDRNGSSTSSVSESSSNDDSSSADGESATNKWMKYKLNDALLSQLLEILTSKSPAMIENYLTDKLRTLDPALLRCASGSIVTVSDDSSTPDDMNYEEETKKWSNGPPSSKRPSEPDDEDVIFMNLNPAKKAKQSETNR